jgi:ABC-type uncharacterized transport system auxiliary subunit
MLQCVLRGIVFSALNVVALIGTSSCVSLKSEYPRITYYRLAPKPIVPMDSRINDILLVKTFSIDSEFDTEHLLAIVPSSTGSGADTEVQRYHYHRWISEPRELVTSYVVNRIQASSLFAGGVFIEHSTITPTVELEGRIIEFTGRNGFSSPSTGKNTTPNSATVVLHLTFKRFLASTPVPVILLQQTYTHTAARPDNTAASISDALSEALSAVIDAALQDVSKLLTTPSTDAKQ